MAEGGAADLAQEVERAVGEDCRGWTGRSGGGAGSTPGIGVGCAVGPVGRRSEARSEFSKRGGRTEEE